MLAILNVVYFGISIAQVYDYFFFKSIGATAPATPPATPPAITVDALKSKKLQSHGSYDCCNSRNKANQ